MKNRQGERGGALLEFAVIAPFMFMVFFGAISFGWMFWLYHSVDYGARIGTRWASVRGADCSNSTVCPTTSANIQTFVKGAVPGLSNATVSTSWSSPSSSTYTSAPTGCSSSNQLQGCIVTVQVSVTQRFIVPFVFSKNITLTSTSQNFVQ